MKQIFRLLIICLLSLPLKLQAIPRSVEIYVDDAKLVGHGRLIYFMFAVYDAYLFAPKGEFTGKPPYALTFRYLRDFTKQQIIDEVFMEMHKLGYENQDKINIWSMQLAQIIPDVVEDQIMTAIAMPGGETAFFSDVRGLGYIDDPEFTKQFFDIWLSENTAEKRLRKQLLNIK